MSRFSLSRRALLRGGASIGIGLPLLEVMLEGPRSARAAPAPKRYLLCFNGQSMGADNDPSHSEYVPDTIGPNYDLKTALLPLATAGVDKLVTVVSGLDIPVANMGPIPAGGRADDFHITSLSPLFSGVRSGDNYVNGPTSDQIVADLIADPMRTRSLSYRVQAEWYLSVSAPYGRDVMSYRDRGGTLEEVAPTVSPQQAFMSLFGNLVIDTDPAVAAEQEFKLRSRKSVIDLVRGDAERLVAKLGGADRRRVERHLDELRDLEKRVHATPPTIAGQCVVPQNPGTDPPIGSPQGHNGMDNTYATNLGYSGEEQRARVFCDLVHMALACDVTRSISLMFTMAQSHLNMFEVTNQGCDLHEVSHNGTPGGTRAVATAQAWHMKHFAYLIDKLRNTPEESQTLLDNTAVVLLNEGGHGLDSATGKEFSSHSTQNMACIVAGAGFVRGHHVVAAGKHPANVLITAMQEVGYAGNSLGEVTGALPELIA